MCRSWHVDVSGIRRGDIVFFDWQNSNNIARIDHVGLVTSVSGRHVHTIEGNVIDNCLRKVRDASTIAGYGRPNYSNKPSGASEYEPFPGAKFFATGRKGPIIAAMHRRLVAEGCNHYKSQTDIDTWGSGDVASYAAWQRKCGYSGRTPTAFPARSLGTSCTFRSTDRQVRVPVALRSRDTDPRRLRRATTEETVS